MGFHKKLYFSYMKSNRKRLLALLFIFAGAILLWFNTKGTPLGQRPPVLISLLGFAIVGIGGYYSYAAAKQRKEEMEDRGEN